VIYWPSQAHFVPSAAISLWWWIFWGWIPVGAKFSVPLQTVPGAHPTSCAMGIGYRVSLTGIKRPVRGVEHQPQSRTEIKERVESLSGLSCPVLGWTLTFLFVFYVFTPFSLSNYFRRFDLHTASTFSVTELSSPGFWSDWDKETVSLLLDALREICHTFLLPITFEST
jgi:hypothetical protein